MASKVSTLTYASSPPSLSLEAVADGAFVWCTQYRFASGSLAQYLGISYEAKFPDTGSVKADDPEKILYDFIPPDYTKSLAAFTDTVEKDGRDFKPIGERIGAYRIKDRGQNGNGNGKGKGKSRAGPVLPDRDWELVDDAETETGDGVQYEAYWSNWDTPGFKEYHRRMQIFALLYIEGASYIDEEDGRWEFVTLYAPSLHQSVAARRCTS